MTTQTTSTIPFDPFASASPEEIMAHAMSLGKDIGAADAFGDKPLGSTEEVAATFDEAKAAEAVKTETSVAAATTTEVAATPSSKDQAVDGVLTKDGKHVIPYAVLSTAREREELARQQAAEAAKRADEAERALADLKAGKVVEAEIAATVAPLKTALADVEAQLASIDENLGQKDVPEILAPMKATLMAQKATLESQIRSEERSLKDQANQTDRQQMDQATSQQELDRQVNAAVDANPQLRYWRDKNPEMFDRAADQDALFRNDKQMQTLSLDERFAKVVAAMEAVHGPTQLPPEYQPKAAVSSGATSVAQAGAKAQPGLQVAAARPLTLTDLPGGAPPITNDASLNSMSNHEISNHINRLMDRGITDPMALIRAVEMPVSV